MALIGANGEFKNASELMTAESSGILSQTITTNPSRAIKPYDK